MAATDTNLCFLTIDEASKLLQRQELSPVELTQAFLDRIAATDEQLHSFLLVTGEQALADRQGGRVGDPSRGLQRGDARHSLCVKGPLRYRRYPHHVRLQS